MMLVFISSMFGQYSGSHHPKSNPGKRVVAYVNNLAEGIDSSIYFYQTIYDTLASVVVREYTTPLEHFFGRDSFFYDDQNRVIAWNAYQRDSNDVYRIMTRRKTVFDDFTHSQVSTAKSYRITGGYYYGTKLVLEFDANKNLKRGSSYLWSIDSARW